jgi:hypothetical protein
MVVPVAIVDADIVGMEFQISVSVLNVPAVGEEVVETVCADGV